MNPIMIPLCECHGAEMSWSKNKRHSNGGYWRCTIEKRNSQRKYSKTKKGKLTNSKSKKKWSRTEHGKKAIAAKDKRYRSTENGKRVRQEANRRYRQTPNGHVREYLRERQGDLAVFKEKVEDDLIDIRKQIKELELVIKQR